MKLLAENKKPPHPKTDSDDPIHREPASPGPQLVPGEGLEPSHTCVRQILSLLRLPFRHPG